MRPPCAPRACIAAATLAASLVVASVHCWRETQPVSFCQYQEELQDQLYGKTYEEVEALLGPPDVRRQQRPGGEMWRYDWIPEPHRMPWPPIVYVQFDEDGRVQRVYLGGNSEEEDVPDDQPTTAPSCIG